MIATAEKNTQTDQALRSERPKRDWKEILKVFEATTLPSLAKGSSYLLLAVVPPSHTISLGETSRGWYVSASACVLYSGSFSAVKKGRNILVCNALSKEQLGLSNGSELIVGEYRVKHTPPVESKPD